MNICIVCEAKDEELKRTVCKNNMPHVVVTVHCRREEHHLENPHPVYKETEHDRMGK